MAVYKREYPVTLCSAISAFAESFFKHVVIPGKAIIK
jgi:hypothetical protein